MPKKRLTTNGNVFRRTDGRWQSVIWYFDEQGIKRRKVFSSKTKTEAQYAAVTDGNAAPAEGKPAVTAESGTTYTINGSDVPVEDASGVALLFDSIIDVSGENRTSLLENKAEDTMETLNKEPASGNRFAYSFQYLDLVDQNNGNAWVKASQDVTIYWPYPAGTNKDTEFTLLHFEGLHREMDTSEIGDQIANCTVSEVTSVKKTDTHLVLKVGSAGFSPFALVWEEKIPTYTITATSNGNGSITPAGVTTVQEGGSQSYTIQADSGYHISDVKVNGKSVGAVESYDFICGCCGRKMQRKRGTGHADWHFFTCITKNRLGANKCTGMYAREEDIFNAIYRQLKDYVNEQYITNSTYNQRRQVLTSQIADLAQRKTTAWINAMEHYEQYVREEISKEEFRVVQDIANRAKEALVQATERKAAYEKQYVTFRKLLSARNRDIPLSEIVDCIDKVVVDGGGKIVIKWNIN